MGKLCHACNQKCDLVDLLDGWATATTATWRSTTTTKIGHTTATRHATTVTTSGLIHLHHDGVHNAFNLLLFRFKLILLCKLIFVEPVKGILDSLLDGVLVTALELFLQLLLLQSVAHGETVVFQTVFRLNLALVLLIFGPELLCL